MKNALRRACLAKYRPLAAIIAALLCLAPPSSHATDMADSWEDSFITHAFRTGSWTKPAALYFALYTSACSDSAGGTEVSGGSYARVALNPLDANWAATAAGNGTTSNLAAITFPAPTANWGTVSHMGVLSASSAGNLYICKALTASKTINNGDQAPLFPISAFTFQVDN